MTVSGSESVSIAKSLPDMAPAFYFSISYMTEHGKPTTSRSHQWIPPTAYGSNTFQAGGASGSWFCCDGQSIAALPRAPQGAEPHKVYSMYYSHGFWITNGDAINNPVSDKEDDNSSEEDNGEEEEGEEEVDEGEREDEDEDEDGTIGRWTRICFDWDTQDYSSYASYHGDRETMYLHRPDQWWAEKLLPNIYHGNLYQTPGYGGLNGDLPLLLGLVAFSARPRDVATVFTECFKGGRWRAHSYPTRIGWTAGRGLVIATYSYPPHSTNEDLESFEKGEMGYVFN